MNVKLFKIIIVFIIILPNHVDAIRIPKSFNQNIHKLYNSDDGLLQNSINSIAQTDDGYLWFATQEGIAKYNGNEFTIFDKNNVKQFEFPLIVKLFKDSKGTLYIVPIRGNIITYKDGKFSSFKKERGVFDKVMDIFEDRAKNIWIATGGSGLLMYKNGKATTFTTKNGLASDYIMQITEDNESNIWVATDKGICKYKEGVFKTFAINNGSPENTTSVIFSDSLGRLWTGGSNGLYLFKGGTFQHFTIKDGLSSNSISVIFEDSDKNVWIGTEKSLDVFPEGIIKKSNRKGTITKTKIMSIFEDREKNIWIGKKGAGINLYYNSKISAYGTKDGMTVDIAFGIMEDRQGQIWVGSRNGGINILQKNGKFNALTEKDGLSNNTPVTFLEDKDNGVWVGNIGGGLHLYKNGAFRNFSFKDELKKESVSAILKDTDNSLWIGTYKNGVKRYKNGNLILSSDQAGNGITSMIKGNDDSIWIASIIKGVTRYKNGTFRTFSKEDGLSSNRVSSIFLDKEGNLWIGTFSFGLNLYRNGKFTTIRRKDGLFDDFAYSIIEDDLGWLWVSTNRGLYKVKKDELLQFAQGKIKKVSSINYNKLDGMLSGECNGAFNGNVMKDSQGRLWYPTVKGIISIDPKNIWINQVPPLVAVEKVTIDDSREVQSGIVLEPGKENIEIDFAALTYVTRERVKLKYRLVGHKDKWTLSSRGTFAKYMNLPYGKYRFEVMASNSDGVWSKQPATFTFEIGPYFYQTFWFRLLCLVSVFCLIYIYIRKDKEIARLKSIDQQQKLQISQMENKEAKRYIAKLTECMEKEKLYRNHDITIYILADHLGITFKYLSILINNYLGKNIYTFINEYRINEIKEKLRNPKYKDENLLTIAFDAGFSTKATFNLVFKKFTGITPSEYRNQINK